MGALRIGLARYLKESTPVRSVFGWTALGNFVPAVWLACTGILVANFAGSYAPVEAIQQLTGSWSWIAMVTLVFACIPTTALTIYGGALSVLTLRIPVSRQMGSVIIAAIAFAAAMYLHDNIFSTFYDFLLLSAYFIAPYITVLVLDYWVGGRRDVSRVGELFDPARSIEWGFVAWLGGALISMPFWVWTRWTGPIAAMHPEWGDLSYLVGAAGAAILYLALTRLPDMSQLIHRSAPRAVMREDASV